MATWISRTRRSRSSCSASSSAAVCSGCSSSLTSCRSATRTRSRSCRRSRPTTREVDRAGARARDGRRPAAVRGRVRPPARALGDGGRAAADRPAAARAAAQDHAGGAADRRAVRGVPSERGAEPSSTTPSCRVQLSVYGGYHQIGSFIAELAEHAPHRHGVEPGTQDQLEGGGRGHHLGRIHRLGLQPELVGGTAAAALGTEERSVECSKLPS